MDLGGDKKICKLYSLPSENAWSGGRWSTPTVKITNKVRQTPPRSGCGVDTEAAGDRVGPLLLERGEVGPWGANVMVLVPTQPCSVHTWKRPSPT